MRPYNPFSLQSMTPVVKYIIIINVAVHFVKWLLMSAFGIDLNALFALNYNLPNFYGHQFITYMFLHDDSNIWHLIYNMLMLWMFGNIIENTLGSKRFLLFYLICGVGSAFTYIATNYLTSPHPQFILAGASGAVYGVMFAFGFLFPNMLVYLYFLIPIKAKYIIIFLVLVELWMGIQNNPLDNVAHFAHLGGMLFAFVCLKYWKIPRIRY